MLERLDTKTFTEEDIQELTQVHKLNIAQIKSWEDFFRFCSASWSSEKIDAFLHNKKPPQSESRIFFVFCWNVMPDFAESFEFFQDGSKVKINYLAASFCTKAGCGNFFIEFDEPVDKRELLDRFEELGAGEIDVHMHKNGDTQENLVNELYHVFEEEDRFRVIRGVCPQPLQEALQKRMNEKLVKVQHVARLNKFNAGEPKLEDKSTTIKAQTARIAALEIDNEVLKQEKEAWLREKADLLRQNEELKLQLGLTSYLKKMMETAQYNHNMMASTMESLASTLEQERAAKRAHA